MHHRVKNNLSIIDSLIEDIKTEFNDDKFQNKLEDLQNRIYSINEVHEQLYKTDDITNLKLKKYIEKLSENVKNTFNNNNIVIEDNIDENLNMEVDKSFPVGLIINEFLTNSFKYAFNKNQKGKINISIFNDNNNYVLSLSDNGKGLSEDFNFENSTSFGMTIMKLLAKQLKGSFDINNKNGLEIKIKFPKK